ncbi:hypothetical protein [Sphingobium sp. Cam5-1]|uniref:hypothetical protein n=1 Tax=Sphingobium sp. Cam5-1 TaxID=2789327 RepID=UPI0018AD1382|nr:hypothetical protein [Sphingobium sp. Cam5-1]QPI73927.1 hypothetical protein IZV00_05540 [Sphingobium sp. Cam5-1]
MPIKFLRDYETKSHPAEVFTAGQLVKDRDEASERHFVIRRAAAYVDAKGNLTDIDGNPVEYVEPEADAPESKPAKGRSAPANVQTSTGKDD